MDQTTQSQDHLLLKTRVDARHRHRFAYQQGRMRARYLFRITDLIHYQTILAFRKNYWTMRYGHPVTSRVVAVVRPLILFANISNNKRHFNPKMSIFSKPPSHR